MREGVAMALGVLVILVFSLPGVKYLNIIFCLGPTAGGLLAAYLVGKWQGDQLDSVEGLKIGLKTALVAALLIWTLNLLAYLIIRMEPRLDPLPPFLYYIGEGFVDGLIGLARGGVPAFAPDITVWEKAIFSTLVMLLFGAFGGVWGASLFEKEPPLETS